MRRLVLSSLFVAALAPRSAEAVDIIVNGSGSTFIIHFTGGYTQARGDAVAAGAQFWADRLGSSVPVEVDMSFAPLSCSPGSGVLGSAGATTVVRDFPGAPHANTWYPPALANSLAGNDLNTGRSDISATFNSSLDDPAQENSCLTGLDWYYGQGSAPPGKIGFYGVVLHELAHGLGFQTFADLGGSGALFYGYDDHFIRFLEDNSASRPLRAGSMNDAQRSAAARDDGDLVWNGPIVAAASGYLTAGRVGSEVMMYAPTSYRSGSSVSHFDTRVSPNAVMEPFETGSTNTTLSEALFHEVGWGSPAGLEITGQQALSMPEDGSLTLVTSNFTLSDPSGTPPGQLTLSVSAGTNYTASGATITPSPNFSGTLSVPVTIANASDTSPTFIATVSVTPVNDAPVITGQAPIVMNEDTSRTLAPNLLTIVDPDDTSFTLSVQAGAHYTVSGTTITPEANFHGLLSVPVAVNDGEASSPVFVLSVEVRPVNDPPEISDHAELTMAEDTMLTLALTHFTVRDADDPPASALSLRAIAGTNYTVEDMRTVRPAPDFFGTLSVTVVVSDGAADSAPYTFPITVTPVNDVPRIVGQTALSVPEDGALEIVVAHLHVVDPDGAGGTYSVAVHAGAHYVVSGRTVTPEADYDGTLSVPVTVSDGIETSAPYVLTINVGPEPDAPRIVGQRSLTIEANSTYRLTASDLVIEDVDSSNAPYGLVLANGAHYAASGADVTPEPNFVGELDVPVHLTEGALASDVFVVRIAVVARPLEALTMQAAGLLTAASAIPVPTDLGALTGTVSITLVDAPAFFRPGRHDLVWRGENEAGQEVFVTQRFDLHPVVSLSIDRVVAEGARTSFSVMLNGPSPVDGFTIPFTVGGQAGPSDHDLVSGTVVFGRGEVEKVVAFQVYEDVVAEGTETIEISIEGVRREIRIVESNLAPRVAIDTLQGGLHTRVFHRTSGAVALASSVEDSNPKDRVTVSYVYPSGDRIDPATMPAGVYPLGVTALDNGAPARSTRFDWWFRVVDLVPDLAADRDTDGDGFDDLAEGFEDPDLDGVPAYLDAWALPHALAVGPAPQHVVDASPGVHLELGPDALLAGHGRLDANAFSADANAVPGAGYVDLVAEVANAGQAARLVVPLVAPLAANQVVRVLDANDRWGTLPATAVASAPLVQGACPAATNAAYRDGLHAGDACLCIALVDGAAHDRDGRANQRVALVVGLGVEAVSTSSGGGSDASVEGTTESENAAPGVQASAKSGESASVEGGAGCTCVTTRMPAAWWVTVFAGALLLLRWAFERRRLARASVRSTRRM